MSETSCSTQAYAQVFVDKWLAWAKNQGLDGSPSNKIEFSNSLTGKLVRNDLPHIPSEFLPKRILYTLARAIQEEVVPVCPTSDPNGLAFWREVIDILWRNTAKPSLLDTQPTEKQAMNNSVPFETISYAFGKDVNKMTDDELIIAAKKCDECINAITSLEGQSTKIDAKIAELKNAKLAILRNLDNRA